MEDPDCLLQNQDIWNAKKVIKRNRLGKYSPTQAILRALYRKRWYVKVQLAAVTKRVKILFFVDKEVMDILCKNFEVLIMDCTYKTNKYGMPLLDIVGHTSIGTTFYIGFAFIYGEKEEVYRWVLQQLKELYKTLGLRDPAVVVTDCDEALINALEAEYPEVKTLLCLFHVNRDVRAWCRPEFGENEEDFNTFYAAYERVVYAHDKPAYREAMNDFEAAYYRDPPSPYEHCWHYVRNIWIVPFREKLCKAWTNKILHFDTTTTSRVEAMHRVLKSVIQRAI